MFVLLMLLVLLLSLLFEGYREEDKPIGAYKLKSKPAQKQMNVGIILVGDKEGNAQHI